MKMGDGYGHINIKPIIEIEEILKTNTDWLNMPFINIDPHWPGLKLH